MAKLRRKVIITTVRWEDTEELTEDQVKRWKSGDEDLQDEVRSPRWQPTGARTRHGPRFDHRAEPRVCR